MKNISKILMSLILVSAIALTFVACSNGTDKTTTAAPTEAASDTADTVSVFGNCRCHSYRR